MRMENQRFCDMVEMGLIGVRSAPCASHSRHATGGHLVEVAAGLTQAAGRVAVQRWFTKVTRT